MPSLFVDAERLRNPNSGLGQVCRHLGRALLELQPSRSGTWDVTFLVPRGGTGTLGGGPRYLEAAWARRFWIPGRFDVGHCLHQDSAYLPRSARLVLTIYDLNFLERTDYSAARKARRLARLQRRVDRAAVVTAGSAFTAAVIRAHLAIDPARLRVVPTGVAVREEDAPSHAPAFLAPDGAPFLLFVGAIHPRKNLHVLLPLLDAFPGHRLVLAGPDHHPYAQRLRDEAAARGVRDRLVVPGGVDEPSKLWLYAHCAALLFPSLSEGFGLPALEAMVFGKPVFLSRLTSLPEIGGADAYYFDDFAPEAMARVVREGLADFGRDPGRPARQRARASRYSWPTVAAEYWSIYEGLASGAS